ncbi:MAG: hypothetical protein ABR987_20770 [Terracidiphilus sp.]
MIAAHGPTARFPRWSGGWNDLVDAGTSRNERVTATPIVVEVKNLDVCLTQELRADALRVIGQFENLPDLRLLAFFDDEDAPFFRRNFGEINRGIFIVLEGIPTIEWPEYLTEHIYAFDDWRYEQHSLIETNVLFENVIYMYGAICSDPVGRVMTFAHELQHFCQYGFNRTLWAECKLFWGLLPAYEIPTEREARIVSKHIAEELCSPDAVNQYISRRIDEAEYHISPKVGDHDSLSPEEIQNWQNDLDDWRFIQQLDELTPYDLATGTKLTFHRLTEHQDELEKRLQEFKDRAEFKEVDLSRYYQTKARKTQ